MAVDSGVYGITCPCDFSSPSNYIIFDYVVIHVWEIPTKLGICITKRQHQKHTCNNWLSNKLCAPSRVPSIASSHSTSMWSRSKEMKHCCTAPARERARMLSSLRMSVSLSPRLNQLYNPGCRALHHLIAHQCDRGLKRWGSAVRLLHVREPECCHL